MNVTQRGRRSRAVIGVAALLCARPALAAVSGARTLGLERRVQGRALCGFDVARDFSLSFEHHLGAAEAKRRVAARLEALRDKFAGKIGSSTITWSGNTAEVRVSAFGQTAVAWVPVGDDYVQIHVHLPILLSPLSGRIQAFLSKTAADALDKKR